MVDVRQVCQQRNVAWFAPDALAALDIHPTMRRQIDDYLGGATPHID